MYGVDPAQDVIFRPPPGFLEQKPHARRDAGVRGGRPSPPPAPIDCSSITSTDLKPGAFVRIDCREKHVVRKVDEGNIVTLEKPLARDVDGRTHRHADSRLRGVQRHQQCRSTCCISVTAVC